MATTGTQIAHQLIAIVLAVVVRINAQVDAEEAVVNSGLMQLHTVARIRYGRALWCDWLCMRTLVKIAAMAEGVILSGVQHRSDSS